jgi:hypothetical protein
MALRAINSGQGGTEWIEVLDEIGRTKEIYFTDVTSEADLQLLVELFERHPDRVGLLRWIVAAITEHPSAAGIKLDSVHLPHVRFERYDDAPVRWAAIVIELMQESLDRDRATVLAAATSVLGPERFSRLGALMVALSRYERYDKPREHYLLELWRQLSDPTWDDQVVVMTALNESLRRRSSGVAESQVWRSLAFPEKIPDLVLSPRP